MIGKYLLDQIQTSLQNADKKKFNKAIQTLNNHQNIFILGAGRSGFVGKFLGMRLMHLGKVAYIVGETNTPAIHKGDLLITVSGSGNTSIIVDMAKKAQQHGATILLLTGNIHSTLYSMADEKILIESRQKDRDKESRHQDKKILREIPLGTSFELSALVYLETVVGELMYLCQITEQQMTQRHVNI